MSTERPADHARYARQIGLAGFGTEAQERLARAAVLIIGAGGLGTPAATYLAAMGVGRLGIVDDDRVDESNLHRQVCYLPTDVGRPKAEVLAERLRAQNPSVRVEPFVRRFDLECVISTIRTADDEDSAGASRLQDFDLVVDASDNLPTRYLLSDACVHHGLPLVYGAAQGYEGQVSTFNLGAGAPTYRCLFPEDAANATIPDCAAGGVLGVVPGIIGCYQALEAVKALTGIGRPLTGKLLLFDGLHSAQQLLSFPAVTENQHVAQAELLARHAPVEEVPADILDRHLRAGGRAVDVRTAGERDARPLPETAHVPLAELEAWISATGRDVAGRVLFVCASGKRSAGAARRFNHATRSRRGVSVRGGERAWREWRAAANASELSRVARAS